MTAERQTVFRDFQQAGTEHHRHGQEKREFRRHRAAQADGDAAQNRRPRTAGSGKHGGNHLKHPHPKSLLIGNRRQLDRMRPMALIAVFHRDKGNAERNQSQRNRPRIIEMLVYPIVQSQTDDRRRHAGQHDFAPQRHGIGLQAQTTGKRPKLVEIQHHHRHNRPQLDHDQKHLPKLGRHVQRHKLVQQNHMPCRTDGQPLGNALHNAEQRGLQYFQHNLILQLQNKSADSTRFRRRMFSDGL